MAAKQYNVVYPKQYKDNDGNDRTAFVRVGTAFPMRDADGFTIELDVPLAFTSDQGRLCLFAREQKDERDNRGGDRRDDRNNNDNNRRSNNRR